MRALEVLLAMAVPGWNARGRRPVVAGILLAVGVVIPLAFAVRTLVSGRAWVALTLDSGYLVEVMIVATVALAARVAAAVELWYTAGAPRDLNKNRALGGAVVIAVCLPLGLVAVEAGRARSALAPVFSSSEEPLWDAGAEPATTTTTRETSAVAVATTSPESPVSFEARPSDTAPESPGATTSSTTTTTLPPKPERPRSGIDSAQLTDISTVLLIGGDAGPDRGGLRTDTMMLFSLHEASGRAALISVPRDLRQMLFPPGSALEAQHPYGFAEPANHVYPIVSVNRGLREAYDTVEGVRPGVVALAHGIGYSLDVTVDDYVLIDMQGFADVVDSVGGVTVNVTKEVPMPGNVPGARTQYPDTIGPGVIHMDGSTALGYVRSRKGDSDYQRTARQRALLAALATQISFENVVLSFHNVVSSVGSTLRTSLEPDELAETLAVIGGQTAIVESVGLVPPLVNVAHPDWSQLARVVGEIQLALVTGVPSGW